MNKGVLYVISGPSGAGKGTICAEFMKRHKEDTYLSISATTRKPRTGEENGKHYFFLEMDDFRELIQNNGLYEYAHFCGNYYGTPKAAVIEAVESGKDVILEIEVQGAMKIRQEHPEAVFIFVVPPSMSELRHRITNRKTETEDIIEERLKTAAWEAQHIKKYNYILLNDDVEKAVCRLEAIMVAERTRVERNKELIMEVFS